MSLLNLSILLLLSIIINENFIFTFTIYGHNHTHKSIKNTKELCPKCLDNHLIQHYFIRKCKPIILGGCNCPSNFNCNFNHNENNDYQQQPQNNNNNSNEIRGRSFDDEFDLFNKCNYKNKLYNIGDIVPTDNKCRICVCSFNSDGNIIVDCPSKIQCPKPKTHGIIMVKPMSINNSPRSIERYRRRLYRNRNRRGNNNNQPLSINESELESSSSLLSLYCYDYYQHDQCCPRQECIPINIQQQQRMGRTGIRQQYGHKTCYFANKEYQLGEKIRLSDILTTNNNDNDINIDNNNLSETIACMRCICTEQWNNTLFMNIDDDNNKNLIKNLPKLLSMDNVSCRKKSCIMELDQRFRNGCIPVYDIDKCCPIDFICPRTKQMSTRVRGFDYGSKLCHFEGRKYPVGARIYQSDANEASNCIDCVCRVPPDFTCIKRKDCQMENL